jgi:hypothetical protein
MSKEEPPLENRHSSCFQEKGGTLVPGAERKETRLIQDSWRGFDGNVEAVTPKYVVGIASASHFRYVP